MLSDVLSLECREASCRNYCVIPAFIILGKQIIHCTVCCITSTSLHTRDGHPYSVLDNFDILNKATTLSLLSQW